MRNAMKYSRSAMLLALLQCSTALSAPLVTPADQGGNPFSASNPAPVTGGLTSPLTQTITRPATTPTYAVGQIVCASPCAAVSWTMTSVPNGKVRLTGFNMRAGGPSVTVTTGASFRVHLDNISWVCTFPNGSFIDVSTDANGKLWAWLQAQGAYVGVANEIFQLDPVGQPMAN
jgi:hypothetical protein